MRFVPLFIFVSIILATFPGWTRADYIVNGGFETGDFTGWRFTGDPTTTAVDNGGPHSGVYNAVLGQAGSLASLSQTIDTTVGTQYTLNFWFAGDGDTPSEFKVSVAGTTLLDLINPPLYSDYQVYSYNFIANTKSTSINFEFRDDNYFMRLDDVSIVSASSIPEPSSLIPLGMGLAMLAGYGWCRGKRST